MAAWGTLVLLAALTGPADDGARVERALEWLSRALVSDEWMKLREDPSNAGSKRRVTEAATRFVLSTHPEFASFDALRSELDARVAETIGGLSGMRGMAFSSWLTGVSALARLEEASRERPDVAALARLAAVAEDRQNVEGGWGHGRPMGVEFYPTTLVAATWWQLLALGGARRFGVEVDDEVVDDALELLSDVQAASGGFAYGGRPYRKGVEAGRTAGVLLGLAALGEADAAMFRDAASYVRRNAASVLDGHASPAMHGAVGALASRLLGAEAAAAYDLTALARIRRAQREDGSFDDPVPGSPDSLRLLGSEATDRAYRTALYAVALSASRSSFVDRLAREVPAVARPETATAGGAALLPDWTLELPGVRAVAIGDGRGVAVDRAGVRRLFDPATGRVSAVREGAPAAEVTRLVAVEGGFLEFRGPADGPVALGGARPAEAGARRRGELSLLEPRSGAPRWTVPCDPALVGIGEVDAGIVVLGRGGRMRVHLPSDGSEDAVIPVPGIAVNCAFTAVGDDAVAIAVERRLVVLTLDGEARWSRTRRGPRGVTPPAYGAVAAAEERVFAGCTDGAVQCRAAADGKIVWEAETGSAVARLGAVDARSVLALGFDGRLHLVRDGAIVWTADPGRGGESTERPGLRVSGGVAWVGAPAGRQLVAYEVATGVPRASLPLRPGDAWSTRGDLAVIGGRGRLACYRLR